MAVAGAVVLLSAGCGARLTRAQMDALDGAAGGPASGQASGQASGAALSPAGGPAGAGAIGPSPAPAGGSVAATIPLGATGPGGGSGAGASGTGGSGTGAATTATTTGAGTAPVAVSGGGGTTGSGTGGGGVGTGTGGGGAPVGAAANPLAGPGGRVCPPGAPGSGPGVTSSTVTIGNISTINGPVPGLFAGARYGTQAVAAYINSLGGLCGRRVVVTAADDQFDQATDQNEASAMANSVLALVGSFSLQDAGIPAGAPGVPDLGDTLSAARYHSASNFSPVPNPPGYITGPFVYLKGQPQYSAATQHMALLVENTPQTAAEGQYLETALKSVGYHFVFIDTTLQPTDPTFNGDVQKMKAAGVTGVVFEATGTIIGQLANAMYQAGIKVVLGNYCAAAYDPAYIKNAGPGVAGTILEQSLALYDGQDASVVPMVATLDQWYARVNPGQVPDLYATYGWMSGLLFAQAVNAGGGLTRAALNAGLQQITSFTGDGLSAPGDPVHKTPPNCWLLIDVKNGQFVRDPATPSGYKCSPAGFYRAT